MADKTTLPLRWKFKKGDRVLYKTPKGNVKNFIFGKQKWYGHSLPSRAFRYFRGKLEFRPPTITEIFTKTFKSYSKEIEESVFDETPLLASMNKFKFDWPQVVVSVPIKYKG